MAIPYYVQGQIRDGGRCVYCGRDLLCDFDTFWGFLENDHLVPKAGNTLENHVTACGSCNHLKGKFVPVGFESMSRDELIAACRDYINLKRAERLDIFRERVHLVRGEGT